VSGVCLLSYLGSLKPLITNNFNLHTLQLIAKGKTPSAIADFLLCSRSSVYRAIEAWRKGKLQEQWWPAFGSTNLISICSPKPDLLQEVPGEIAQVSADVGYHQRKCYDTLNRHGAKSAIPPRKGAKIWRRANSKAECHVRDENLRRRSAWHVHRARQMANFGQWL
jgi:Homeodomain-like domain/Transposase DDE domain